MVMLNRGGTPCQATSIISCYGAAVNLDAKKKSKKFFENLLTNTAKVWYNGYTGKRKDPFVKRDGQAHLPQKDFSILIGYPMCSEDNLKITR